MESIYLLIFHHKFTTSTILTKLGKIYNGFFLDRNQYIFHASKASLLHCLMHVLPNL